MNAHKTFAAIDRRNKHCAVCLRAITMRAEYGHPKAVRYDCPCGWFQWRNLGT